MATNTRIYIVTPKVITEQTAPAAARLVRASHPSHALHHVASNTMNVTVASQNDLVAALAKGIKVEDIKPEQREL